MSINSAPPLIFAQLHSLISLTRLLKGFQMEEEIEDDLLFLAAAAACVTMRYVDDVFTMSSGNARIRTGPG